jgi:ABC-type Na+ transport system ATPase subunit NatA
MRKARKRATWAILICLLAGAGITVPLRVKYDLVEVRDGALVIHPSVYRSKNARVKKQVLTALEEQGLAIDALKSERLDRLTRVRNAMRLRVSLDTLVAAAGPEVR